MCGTCSCRFRERVGVFFFYWISPAVKPAPRCHRRRRPAVSGTLPFLFFLTNHVFSAGSAYRQVPSRCSFPSTALLRILPLIVRNTATTYPFVTVHYLPSCRHVYCIHPFAHARWAVLTRRGQLCLAWVCYIWLEPPSFRLASRPTNN